MINKIKIYTIYIFLFAILPVLAQNSKNDVTGIWGGELDLGAAKLKVVLKISKDSANHYTTLLDSPDQAAFDIPTKSTTISDGKIVVAMPALVASFVGNLLLDRDMIDGTFTQNGATFNLTLRRTTETPKIKRPQEPKPPFDYIEKEVTVHNAKANLDLAGSLSYPKNGTKFRTVVLITGSGAQNRNEELLGHKPFLVISDYLVKAGYAVLRCDDRGYGKSTGKFDTGTTLDFVTDINAMVDFISTQTYFETNGISLIGHSEGGLIAPIVASENSKVTSIILLAGTGVIGADIIELQTKLLMDAVGTPKDIVEIEGKVLKNIFTELKKRPSTEDFRNFIITELKKTAASLSNEEKEQLNLKDTTSIYGIANSFTSPWMMCFLLLDPAPYLEKVKVPVLALNGTKDLQVEVNQNLTKIESSLKKGGNKNLTAIKLEGLNHLFQHCDTGSETEYVKIEETISHEVLKLMADWLTKN